MVQFHYPSKFFLCQTDERQNHWSLLHGRARVREALYSPLNRPLPAKTTLHWSHHTVASVADPDPQMIHTLVANPVSV
jgi:hypothetical protein